MHLLKPGTGTNPYYAKKHGLPVRNVVDCLGLSLCEQYRPTGATNSIDALQILWEGERHEPPARSFRPAAATPPPPSYSGNYAYTYAPPAPSSTGSVTEMKEPLQSLTPADVQATLQPVKGWTEQDCARQQQALRHCPGMNGQAVVSSAFDRSVNLASSSFAKSGWAAGLTVVSALVGVAGLATALTNPGSAATLLGAAVGGGVGARLLVKSAGRDHNNASILGDLGTRIHQRAYGVESNRGANHGNYSDDFRP